MTMTLNCSRLMASGLIGETLHSCTFFERKPTNLFSSRIRNLEEEIKKHVKKVDELKVLAWRHALDSLRLSLCSQGIKDSDTGLSNPGQWDLDGDAQLRNQHPLQVARCTKIIQPNLELNPKDKAKYVLMRALLLPPRDIFLSRYVINIRQYAKFVVALHDDVASTDVEEGMRVGVDRQTYKIMLPLPAKIDPTVTMMQARQCPPLEMHLNSLETPVFSTSNPHSGRRKTRCDLQRRRRLQRLHREAARGG